MISLILYVLTVIGLWKIFEKLGEAGWKSLIPIYNLIVLLQLLKWDLWKIVLFIIPLVNLFFTFMLWWDLSKKFGKGAGFAIGILFLPFIFIPILGFGAGSVVNDEPSDLLK